MNKSTTSHYTVYGTLTVVSGAWAKAAIPEQLPSVSGTDNGKALMVSGGKWQKSSLPDAGADTKGLVKQAANVAESSATSVADLKTDLNALLAALKAAGIMVADAEETEET